jgi:hypothetical protein
MTFRVEVAEIANGPPVPVKHAPAGDEVGLVPLVVPQRVAPDVAVLQVTDMAAGKVAGAVGLQVGVATTLGGGMVMV